MSTSPGPSERLSAITGSPSVRIDEAEEVVAALERFYAGRMPEVASS